MVKGTLEDLVKPEVRRIPVFIEKHMFDTKFSLDCDACGTDISEKGIPILIQLNERVFGPYCCQKCANADIITDYAWQLTITSGWKNYMHFWNAYMPPQLEVTEYHWLSNNDWS